MVIHTDSTSAIARAGHTGAGRGQFHAVVICRLVSRLKRQGHNVEISGSKDTPVFPEMKRRTPSRDVQPRKEDLGRQRLP